MKVSFNRPTVTGRESKYIKEVFDNCKFSGDGPMSRRCNEWLKGELGAHAVYVTSSCTHALEMAAILCELKPGDEVILPSFAFSSTATAFVRAGASLVFVDVKPGTMNLDVAAVEGAVSERTRAVVALHYAGLSCDMEALHAIADEHRLLIVEDAAQGIFSKYGNDPLGTIGDFGCISFHESKNIHCGEGGALVINNPNFVERAEMILEKGTNRMKFKRGGVSKYTWYDIGSSYVLSDLNCAFLLAQLEMGREITADRVRSWNEYRRKLEGLADRGLIEIPGAYESDQHNGHIFWMKLADMSTRDSLMTYLNSGEIMATFHYIPLHSAPAGCRYGRFVGRDSYTTSESQRLLRLPIYYGFQECDRVVDAITSYFD